MLFLKIFYISNCSANGLQFIDNTDHFKSLRDFPGSPLVKTCPPVQGMYIRAKISHALRPKKKQSITQKQYSTQTLKMVHIKINLKIDNVLILNNTKISSIFRNASTDIIFVSPSILIHFTVYLICALLLPFPT